MTYIPGGGGGGGSVSTSSDVALNNPTSGQSLTYDAAIGKWVNSPLVASSLYIARVIYNSTSSSWPARPAVTNVEWIGPVDPTSRALDNDTWINTTLINNIAQSFIRLSGTWVSIGTSSSTSTPPPSTSTFTSSVHSAQDRSRYDAFSIWRNKACDGPAVYIHKGSTSQTQTQSWDSIQYGNDWVLDPYEGTTGRMLFFVPLVPFDSRGESGDYQADIQAGSTGANDSKWVECGKNLAAKNGTPRNLPAEIIIIPGWEFNGDWFGMNRHADPVIWAAYHRRIIANIKNGYSQAGGTSTLKSGVCVSRGNSPGLANGVSAQQYDPGAGYLDYWCLNSYDIWPPIKDETSWQTQKTQANGLDANLNHAKSRGLPLLITEWGIWNKPDDTINYGGDNAYYVQRMHQWFTANPEISGEWYFEHPSTPYHWISNNPSSNPNAAAKYLELFGA